MYFSTRQSLSFRATRASAIGPIAIAIATLVAACGSSSYDDLAPPPSQEETQRAATIKRDAYGVPHVYAEDTFGLFFGMGYAVAEDRLFQWEMLKRMGRGTAAEVLGSSMLNADMQARRDYDPTLIQAQIDALPQDDRDILEGYAAGYNKRLNEVLANPAELLPIQFTEFGFLPTELTPLDIIGVHIRSIATNFSDANSEVTNLGMLTELKARYGDSVGQQVFDQLRWINDQRATTTIAAEDQVALAAATQATGTAILASKTATLPDETAVAPGLKPLSPAAMEQERLAQVERYGAFGPDFFPRASNTWTLGKSKVAEGHPVFVIGPQYGNSSPGNPYGIGLHGAGWDFVGSSSWGLPLANWGLNARVGWGVTVGGGDTTDMYQTTLNPANQFQYQFNGSMRDMDKRIEVIQVKGADPVILELYSTVHGQVESFDLPQGVAYAKKRSWHGKEVESLICWTRMNQAQDWEQFLAQGRRMPLTMNWYYIDSEDNIGQAFLGHFPIKPPGQDSRLPTPGDGSMEWQGMLPFENIPKVFNPTQDYIVNWNNKIQPNWDNSDSRFWGQMHHVDIPVDIIASKARFNLAEIDTINIRSSFTEANVKYFRPFIRDAVQSLPNGNPIKAAGELIAEWDGMASDPQQAGTYDSPAYTVFRAWLPRMIERTLQDDIPASFYSQYRSASATNPSMGANVTLNALQGDDAGVPQHYDFFNGADKYEVVREALVDAVTELEARYGPDMEKWLTPVLPHRFGVTTFGGVPVNTPERSEELPVAMSRGTSNHRIMFPNGNADYEDVTPPGQSAFIAPDGTKSRHYDDQLELYRDFRRKEGWLRASDVDANAVSTTEVEYTRQ